MPFVLTAWASGIHYCADSVCLSSTGPIPGGYRLFGVFAGDDSVLLFISIPSLFVCHCSLLSFDIIDVVSYPYAIEDL